MKTSTFTWRKIKTDAKMKFYTGISTVVLFNKIFRFIQPFLSDIVYWKRPKYAKKKLANSGIEFVTLLKT